MTGERAVLLVCVFAAGVLARDIAQDFRTPQREAAPLPVAENYGSRGATSPAPASLHFPLCDAQTGGWVASCTDGRDCRFSCLPVLVGVDDPGAAGFEPEGNLKDMRKRTP